ncbi:MAG: hypothetical protein ACOYBY_18190, partial [Dermatophilaceae bacterium]
QGGMNLNGEHIPTWGGLRLLLLLSCVALIVALAPQTQATATPAASATPVASSASPQAQLVAVPLTPNRPALLQTGSGQAAPLQGISLAAAQSAAAQHISIEVRDAQGRLVTLPKGTASPQVSVGLGWYVYIYLNAGNINWLRGLGYTAATGALCALLVETVVGAIACGVAAYIVYTIFYRPTVLPSGYCIEYKFTYGGSFVGSKLVRRSC